MTTVNEVPKTSVGGYFKRLLANYLKKNLSPANKRLIFLTSLAAYVRNDTNPDAAVLERLNELFSLSKDPATFRFPMLIHPRIWNAFDVTDLRNKGINCTTVSDLARVPTEMKQYRIIASHLIEYAPEWMRYGSGTTMRKDIVHLFKNAATLAAPKAPTPAPAPTVEV